MTKDEINAMKRQLLSEMEKDVQFRVSEFKAQQKLVKPEQFVCKVQKFNELMKLCHQFDGLEKELEGLVVAVPLEN